MIQRSKFYLNRTGRNWHDRAARPKVPEFSGVDGDHRIRPLTVGSGEVSWLHTLTVNEDGHVETGGVHYGPYDALTLLWQGERLAVVHCKGHKQYWGQTGHYIPASVMVFEKMDTNEYDQWLVRRVKETETGRASRRVKADMIAWAKEQEVEGVR